MKHISQPAPRRLPLVGTLAWLTVVLALATVPMAMAKYKATGTGNAAARIAKWAPQMEVASVWGTKTAFIAHSGQWMPVTDGERLSTARGNEWAFRPSNANCEVMAKFNYSITATGAQPWVHFDVGGLNAVNVVGTYSDFREDVFEALEDEAASMTFNVPTSPDLMDLQEIYVYLTHGIRPYTHVGCYADATFSWTVEQID